MSKITVPLGRLRRQSPLHPQPIVNSLCSKLRQATAHAKESVEFTEKNTDLPAVDGQQVSRCAQIGSPALRRTNERRLGARRRHPNDRAAISGSTSRLLLEILTQLGSTTTDASASARLGSCTMTIAARTSTIPKL